MSGLKTLLGFFLITWFSVISAEPHQNQDSANTTEPTVYEMLEKFNLPRGILPQGAKGYVLHEDNRFEVFLEGDCKFGVEGGYSLNYKSKIAGKVGFGSLKDLQGVSVKVFFVWLSITEVSIEDGELDLYVGLMSASFPLSNFDECPRCGCGLDCINTGYILTPEIDGTVQMKSYPTCNAEIRVAINEDLSIGISGRFLSGITVTEKP